MRSSEVVREAWRDIASGAAWAATAAVVLAVLLAGIVGLRAMGVVADVRAATRYVASGAATTVQRAEGRIDGRVCDALGGSEGVIASGALRRLEQGAVPAALPRSAVPTYEVTVGVLGVLGVPESAGSVGVVLSPAVHDALGLGPGDDLAMTSGSTVTVTGVYAYPDDGRDPDLEYALLAPTADDGEPFDACWVTVWPLRDDTVPMLRRAVLPATGAEGEDRPTVGQLNPRLGETFVRSGDVPAVVPMAVAGATGTAVGAAAVMRRRLSLASDLHVGVPRSAQVAGIVLQHLVWASAAALAAVATATIIVRGLPADDAVPIVTAAVAVAVVGVVGTLVGGALAATSVRERSLHRYFRAR
ncbi:hypothetical protein GCM10017714_20920 [Curtobacterium pusillum]|uniref:ABC transporter permease n=1 Tax=Curtobacterium pusillum TaxID=69373 RepID=A0ABX2MCH4_9MICO|nr:hypothetical protein [Curtobacterium pusillum]NUU14615.1 hypothetical protein [Curtobacterium pusillum]GLK31951.1 hypothetical protein GCM10017610_22360 [Curtobacterium pusillum]